MTEAVLGAPDEVEVAQVKWTWKAVRQYLKVKFECVLSSSCLNYLHRLGFVVKRLAKANPEKRTAFVAEYMTLREEAKGQGAKIFLCR